MKTVEEKAEEYADREIPIVYTDETQTISLTELRQAAKIDYLAGYSEAMRCQSSPNVEQLEWIEDYGYIKAKTPFFKYMVVIIGGKAGLCFDGNDGFLKFKTVYDAKAAAQADFEWRVMACLDIADNSNK